MINFLRIVSNIRLGDYLHQDGTINNIPSSDVIGVCVIPSNFLPDKYARFISLTQRSYFYQQWGKNIRLKSKYKIGLPGPEGRKKDTFYWGFIRKGEMLLTSPYSSEDSFNPEFLRDLSRAGNAFQDYKGYENLKIYKEKYGDNKLPNAFKVVIENSPSYRRNDWYLPAIGELAFIPPRLEFIRDKIHGALIAGSEGIVLSTNYFWSSTEKDSENAWEVGMYFGSINFHGKDGRNYIRAFLAL